LLVLISFWQIKYYVGKRVNIRLKNGKVIVNVFVSKFIYQRNKNGVGEGKIEIRYDKTREEIPIAEVKEFLKV